jgi:LysM repeat protein
MSLEPSHPIQEFAGQHRAPRRSSRLRQMLALTLVTGLAGASPLFLAAQPAQADNINWDAIASCESGNRWHINTGNSFSGGLQFTGSTWRANGGNKYARSAHMASREQQIAVAQRVVQTQGLGAWPTCGRNARKRASRSYSRASGPSRRYATHQRYTAAKSYTATKRHTAAKRYISTRRHTTTTRRYGATHQYRATQRYQATQRYRASQRRQAALRHQAIQRASTAHRSAALVAKQPAVVVRHLAVRQQSEAQRYYSTPLSARSAPVIAPHVAYIVRRGDTLLLIARRNRVDWKQLYAVNRQVIGVDANLILAGQRLILR